MIRALGVIMYVLCCRRLPYAISDKQDFSKIQWDDYQVKYDPKYWSHMSQESKNLISSMLTVDASQRPTIHQVLDSSWVKKQKIVRLLNFQYLLSG
jgi:serine/threonine protein kinase